MSEEKRGQEKGSGLAIQHSQREGKKVSELFLAGERCSNSQFSRKIVLTPFPATSETR